MPETTTDPLIWLPGNLVAYEPTFDGCPILEFEDLGNGTFELLTCGNHANGTCKGDWEFTGIQWEEFIAEHLGSEVERECSRCIGRGWIFEPSIYRGHDSKVSCPDCTDGTQKRRIVSVSLQTVWDVATQIPGANSNDGRITSHLPLGSYLIVAQTESA